LSYRAVVAVAGAPRLLATSVLGRLPLGTSTIALLLFVHDLRGSFAAAGAVVAAFTLTGALAAPVQGALVDRRGPTGVLLVCAAGHAAGLVAIVLAGRSGAEPSTLVAIAAPTGALVPPISSCARAVWPTVAPDAGTREAGYALDAVAQELIWTLGPLLVALSIALADPTAALLLSAALTLAGTALFGSSPLVRAYRGGADGNAPPRVLRAAGMARVMAGIAVMGVGLGASEVGLPAIAVEIGSPGLGALLLALLSVGSVAGGVWYGSRHWSSSLQRRHGALLLGLAALTVPMIVAARSPASAIALSLLAGVAWSPVLSCQYALVAELAPSGAVTSAFTWSTAVVVAGIAAGSALAGALVDATSGHWALALAASGYVGAGLLALSDQPRSLRQRST
jgi:MFS family permease